MHQAQLSHRLEDEQRRQDESNKSVEKWLGQERFDKLLRLSQVQSERELAPVWNRLANSKKASWGSVVQAMYDEALDRLNESHLTMVSDQATINATVGLAWAMTTRDSIDTGINPFRFGDTDVEAAQL